MKKFCIGNCYFTNKHLRKILLIMKITTLLLLFTILQSTANVLSQTISVDVRNQSMRDVLRMIETQTDYRFFYNDQLSGLNTPVTIKAENKTLEEVLNQLLDRQQFSFTAMENKMIVIVPKEFMQLPVVSGTVTDDKGMPLPGVSILIKGTTLGTITNIEGKFELDLTPDAQILVFSFMGMKTQEIPIGDMKVFNIILKEELIGLDELVVVGYGTQKKINLTGSVDVVGNDKLENRGLINSVDALQGISGNLNISPTNRGGEPGAARNMNIRGIGTLTGNGGEPYVLVDGVPMDINNLDPNNIESISVLKDAAASAIYGARAAYGVILVKTKIGEKNKPMSVQLSTNMSYRFPAILPHNAQSLDVARYINNSYANSGNLPVYTEEHINRIISYANGEIEEEVTPDADGNFGTAGSIMQANNDWPYLTFGNWAPQQKYNISVTGGGNESTYYVSTGYSKIDGLMTWGDEEFRNDYVIANLSTSLRKWFTLNFNMNYTFSNDQKAVAKNDRDREDYWKRTIEQPSIAALYAPNGTILHQEIATVDQLKGNDRTQTNNLWLKLGGELTPFEGFTTNISYARNIIGQRRSVHKATTYTLINIDGTTRPNQYQNPSYEVNFAEDNYYIFNLVSSFEKSFGNHYLKTLVGYEEEFSQNRGIYGTRNGLLSSEVPALSLGIGQDLLLTDTWTSWATQGFFSRINYNYREKYIFELNARYDGSSRFQNADDKWGFFPSVAVGYNISRESFWSSSKVLSYINNFKIRGSYGSLGNQNVPNYTYLALIPINSQVDYIFGNSRPPEANMPSLVSSRLTWETANTINFGVDAGFINNQFNITFDWFKRNTINMFGPAETLPIVLGTTPSIRNNAELSTTGFDMKILWRDMIGTNLNYSIEFLLGDNKSKVVKYNNPTNYLYSWYEGQIVGDIWGYETLGFFKDDTDVANHTDQSVFFSRWSAGDIKYKDLDGDDIITFGNNTLDNHGDLKIIGNSQPRYQFGAIGSMNIKGFDFRIFFQGVGKKDIFINDDIFFGHRIGSIAFSEHMDYWTPEGSNIGGGPNAYFPKRYSDASEDVKNRQIQSKYLQDASFIRLKEIQLGYTIPQEISRKININNSRIYVIGHNIMTLTNLIIFDPENIFTNGFYPINKFYGVGLNITF